MECVSEPTETRYSTDVVTIPQIGGVTTKSTITGEPKVITSFDVVCTLTVNDTCDGSSTVANVITEAGEPVVTQWVIDIDSYTVSFRSVPILTLYSTSCPDTRISDSFTPPETSDTEATTPVEPSTVIVERPTTIQRTTVVTVDRPTNARPTTTVVVTVRPSPTPPRTTSVQVQTTTTTVVTTLTVTRSDGVLVQTTSVGVYLSTPQTGGKSNTVTIVGIAVGGFIGFCVLVGLCWLLRKRCGSRRDDIHTRQYEVDQEDDYRQRNTNPVAIEPIPYQYGVVGSNIPPSLAHRPPVHSRSPSDTPLLNHRNSHSTDMSPTMAATMYSLSTQSPRASYHSPPSKTHPIPEYQARPEHRPPPSEGSTSKHGPTASSSSLNSGLAFAPAVSAHPKLLDELGRMSPESHTTVTTSSKEIPTGVSSAVQRRPLPQIQAIAQAIPSSASSSGRISPTNSGPSSSYGGPAASVSARGKSEQAAQNVRPQSPELAPPPYSPAAEMQTMSPVPVQVGGGGGGQFALANPDLLDTSPPSSPELRRRR